MKEVLITVNCVNKGFKVQRFVAGLQIISQATAVLESERIFQLFLLKSLVEEGEKELNENMLCMSSD